MLRRAVLMQPNSPLAKSPDRGCPCKAIYPPPALVLPEIMGSSSVNTGNESFDTLRQQTFNSTATNHRRGNSTHARTGPAISLLSPRNILKEEDA